MLRALHAMTSPCSSFLFISLVRLCCLATPPECKWRPDPAELWHGRGVFEAAYLSGNPSVSLPLIGSGFNRTLNLDGFCNNVLYQAKNFKCGKNGGGEYHAEAKNPGKTGIFLRFDRANCPLSGISVRRTLPQERTPTMPYHAQIRFEFQWCQPEAGAASPPAARAALTMGLRNGTPGTATGINLHGWMDEACNAPTPAPPTLISVKDKTEEVKVGYGQCNGNHSKEVTTTMKTEGACKTECGIRNTNPAYSDEKCTAFAFYNSSTIPLETRCIIYQDDKITAVKSQDSKWVCWDMKLAKGGSDVAQQQLPAAEKDSNQVLGEALAVLRLREALAGPQDDMAQAKVYEFQPRADDICCANGKTECFSGMWWFEPEDKAGVMTALEIEQSSWAALASYIPEPKKLQDPLDKGHLYIDRVLVKTCKTELAGWGRDCIMPEEKKVCDNRQIITSIITGLVVPLAGWIAVKGFSSGCKPPPKTDTSQYDGKAPPRCSLPTFLLSCLIALVVCGGVAALLSWAISNLEGSTGCLHGERDMWIIAMAATFAGTFAIWGGLVYTYLVATHQSNQGPKDAQHKLMLVQVDENDWDSRKPGEKIKATPLNADIMASGRAGAQIEIDRVPQDLGAFQSGGSFGSNIMSTNRSMQ